MPSDSFSSVFPNLYRNDKSRPLNSHGFTVCYTVSLSFSRSHRRFFISHGFTNFKRIFSQSHNFLGKQTWEHNPLSKNIAALSFTYKIILSFTQIINNSVIFDSETTTRNSSGNGWPVNYQKLYEIKHQSKGSFWG